MNSPGLPGRTAAAGLSLRCPTVARTHRLSPGPSLVSSLTQAEPGQHHDDVCHAAAGAGGPPRPAIMIRLDRAGQAVRAATPGQRLLRRRCPAGLGLRLGVGVYRSESAEPSHGPWPQKVVPSLSVTVTACRAWSCDSQSRTEYESYSESLTETDRTVRAGRAAGRGHGPRHCQAPAPT
jgi:hypothetical protein